jgi:D-alanyl-D-alanine carboxypeptidase (penicillin-binding protein 5/6)
MSLRDIKLNMLITNNFRSLFSLVVLLLHFPAYSSSPLKAEVYPNDLKNWEFGKKAPQNFYSEQTTIAERQGSSENENSEVYHTRSKTNFSSRLGISAQAAVLINAETGAILFEKNARTPLYPASITKVVTALYALEKKADALDQLVTASSDAVGAVSPTVRRNPSNGHPPYRLEFGGTHMGIKTGEILPLRTLFYGLMLVSANDAANVIAQYVSGSIPQFMQELNAYIQAQGCADTIFYTPHGLPHPDHKTTALDMAKLTQLALKHPFFREVVKTIKYSRGVTNKQLDANLIQHNALLMRGKFHYPKAIGVKTGYTLSGGHTLIAAAEDEERKLIAVLLGCSQVAQRYQDAISLFESAFQEVKVARTLFSKEFDHFCCTVKGGAKTLVADLPSDFLLYYYPSEEPLFTTEVVWNDPVFPVEPGQKVGEIRALSSEGKILARESLFATQFVDSTLSYKIENAYQLLKNAIRRYFPWILAAIGVLLLVTGFRHSLVPSRRG